MPVMGKERADLAAASALSAAGPFTFVLTDVFNVLLGQTNH